VLLAISAAFTENGRAGQLAAAGRLTSDHRSKARFSELRSGRAGGPVHRFARTGLVDDMSAMCVRRSATAMGGDLNA
jgi:hypothetical protein